MAEFKPGENVLVLARVKSIITNKDGIFYEVHALDDGSEWSMTIPEKDTFDPVTRKSGLEEAQVE
jgi:hypothetical protein